MIAGALLAAAYWTLALTMHSLESPMENILRVMSSLHNPVRPGIKPSDDKVVTVLREHLSDDDAAMLAERLKATDEIGEDWLVVKARIFKQRQRIP